MTKLSKDAPAEISHPAHPEHMLKLVDPGGDDASFQCDGCMEPGAGARYMCDCRPAGNFVLHMGCALAEATLVHPLLKKSKFQLRHEPPAPTDDEARLCDACGGKVRGFYYHCAKTDLDLHPCCAKLPLEVRHEELTFELRKEASHRCRRCRTIDGFYSFWFYRSTCKTVYLHVACVKEEMESRNGAGSVGSSTDDSRMICFVKEAALQSYRREGAESTKLERICKMVVTVVRIIIAAIIGDPTPILVAGVAALLSNV